MKPDKAKQAVLLNKCTAAIQRQGECVVVLNGINSPSGEPALEMASGNFLDVMKKYLCALDLDLQCKGQSPLLPFHSTLTSSWIP